MFFTPAGLLAQKALSEKQLADIHSRLATATDQVTRIKLHVLLTEDATRYRGKPEQLSARRGLYQELKEKETYRNEHIANLYQLSTLYFQTGDLSAAFTHFERLFEMLQRTDIRLRNLVLQHLSAIAGRQQWLDQEEKYLALFVIGQSKGVSFYATTGGFEQLMTLAQKTRSGREHHYFENWYQAAALNGTSKDQENVLTQWVNFATTDPANFSDKPFDAFLEYLETKDAPAEAHELRRLYAQHTVDENRKTRLYEEIHRYNRSRGEPTELGVLTRLYVSYRNEGDSRREQALLEVLSEREDYNERQEALRQLAILSQRNEDWVLSLNTHQKLLELMPPELSEDGVMILDNLIGISQRLSREDLVLQYLRQKALTSSAFVGDEARYQAFMPAVDLYRQNRDFEAAGHLYRQMRDVGFKVSPYPRMYEIHFQGALIAEESGAFEEAIDTYQLSLDALLESPEPDLNQAVAIAQRILLLTESRFPGEREIAALEQIRRLHDRRGQPLDRARTELIIAQKLEKAGDRPRAIDHYRQSLESFRQANDSQMVSQLLTLLTNLEEGTSGERLQRLQELEAAQERSADRPALIRTRLEIGNYHKSQGDNENALLYYLKAADSDPSAVIIETLEAAYYAGILLAQTGEIDRSSQWYQQALSRQALQTGNEALFAQIRQALARNYNQQGRIAEALQEIDTALALPVEELTLSLLETKTAIQINGGQYAAAEETAAGYLAAAAAATDPALIPLLVLQAKARIGLQDYPGALAVLEKALQLHGDSPFDNHLYDILSLKATCYNLQKDMVAAIRYQQQLISLIEQSTEKQWLGTANLDLARYYLEIGRILEALRANNQAEPWVAEGTDDQLMLWLNFAKAYQKQGKHTESLESFSRLQAAVQPGSARDIVAEMHYQRGMTYLSAFQFLEALGDFQQAERDYQALNRPPEVAQSKMAQANVSISLGKIMEAERIYLALLEDTLEDSAIRGDVDNALAFLYSELGQYTKALTYSDAAEAAYRKAGQESRIPEVLNARGLVFLKMNDFDQAEVTFVRALRENAANSNPLLDSEITNNLGGLYRGKGDLERAREQLTKTAELQRQLGFESLLALTFNNIGSVYLEEGRFDEALSFLRQSREFALRFNLKKELASSWNNEGILFFKQQQFEKAENAFNEAIKPQQELALKIDLARSHNNLSVIAARKEDYPKALALVQVAVDSLSLKPLPADGFFPNPEADSVLAPDLMKDSLQIKGGHLREMANRSQGETDKIRYLDASYQSYALAIDIIEALRAQMKGEESQTKLMQANIDIFQQLVAILYELGQKNPDRGFHQQAFYYSEMSRARSFLDQLQEQVARTSLTLPEDIRNREDELKNDIANLDALIFAELSKAQQERDQSKIEEWQIRKTESLLQYRNFAGELEQRFPALASLKYPKVYGIEDVQAELLDEASLILTYFLGEDRSYGWVIGKDHFSMVDLPPNADIDQLIRRFRVTLVDPLIYPDEDDDAVMIDASPSHIAVGLQIYRSVLAPLLEKAEGTIEHILIIPDGVLFYLPFETVLMQIHPQTDERFPKGREYLLHRYATYYSPSASVLGMIQTQVRNRDPVEMAQRRTFLGFGDPEYRPPRESEQDFEYNPTLQRQGFYNLFRLFNSRIELREIASIFADSNDTFLGEEAKESQVKSSVMGYQYIHFATHGILDERNPEFSGVVMNLVQPDDPEDGFLQASEIFDLRMNSDLVVLSACETGLGKVIKGEGMVGLTRSFLFAGTPSIVVSLWTVADESTSKLMIYFYEFLSQGHPKVEALRKARLKLMNEKVGGELFYADPFFWGPFILNGMHSI